MCNGPPVLSLKSRQDTPTPQGHRAQSDTNVGPGDTGGPG